MAARCLSAARLSQTRALALPQVCWRGRHPRSHLMCSATVVSAQWSSYPLCTSASRHQMLLSPVMAVHQRSSYSTAGGEGGGPGTFMSRLARQLMWAGIAMGLSAAALLYVYSKLAEGVERMSWLERYLPSSMAQRLSDSLSSMSQWTKGLAKERAASQSSQEGAERGFPYQRSDSGASAHERRLERDNRSLQSKVEQQERQISELQGALRRKRTSPTDDGPKSLIEMYSDILALLTEFDAQSKSGKFVDQLPKVVVVGDQSAGKTSVLEMIANARIFPRGGGEMMTRAPVVVTLIDAPQHVAEFRDGGVVYQLDKESELKSLRREIEARMLHSVKQQGSTVSSEPVFLTVRGPQLKRMVLVDLPGVISTVTTGMATDTRENIVRMCKRYMQNPNSIIMCIQDGSLDAERSIVTDVVREVNPDGRRTIFVLTKVDLAEKSGVRAERVRSILAGTLFPMKAMGYFAVVTGSGNNSESIPTIQKYEKEYFSRSKLFQSGMLMENQLGTRNMVKAVTEEFWRMVQNSIHDQTLKFKALRYRLEAEWRNKFPGERVLDRSDLFEVEKANLLREVASLVLIRPAQWEEMFYECLWRKMAPQALETILMEASQAEDFSTEVDIALRKWAEDEGHLAQLCTAAAQESVLEVLRSKIEATKGGPFHSLSQGMRRYVEEECRKLHQWSPDNVDQLRSVQITTLEDKDVRDEGEWSQAAAFLISSLQDQVKTAEDGLKILTGPNSVYERWVQWQSSTTRQADNQLLSSELEKFLTAEPDHSSLLAADEVLTVQRVLKTKGKTFSDEQVALVWSHLFKFHFLKESLRKANDCRRAFYLRQHDPQRFSCPQVVYMWRLQQLMKRCAHTLRVQLMDYEVRQLELQVKSILGSITNDDQTKKRLITGVAVEKAEQLKQVRVIQERLETFQTALKKDKSDL